MASVISRGELRELGSPYAGVGSAWGPIMYSGIPESIHDIEGCLEPFQVWATQPSVRKVVDFIARAVASTPLKVYRRVSDTDRQRVVDGPLASILAAPAPGMTPFRFWHSIVVDWLMYDRWAVLKMSSLAPDRPLDLLRIQAQRVTFGDDGLGNVTAVWVDGRKEIDPKDCLFDHGYAAISANGTSPMRTLSAILQESKEAVEYRRGVWRNGARVPAVIERPAAAPEWTPTARARFLGGWRAYMKGGGSEGGTPILEDGMQLKESKAFAPRDTLDIEGRQLNDAEVAAAYHIAPELVGAREGNYSNIQAFREMLYGDALGPYYAPIEQVVNAMLVAGLDDTDELYAEFDIETKMRGSFETQAAVLSTSVGRPWMTAAEARARANLRDLGGNTDDLVTPLNVLVGGQASPRDSGSQNRNAAPRRQFKARANESHDAKAEEVLRGFFERQRRAVLAALGVKADADWWDADRWDSELSDSLYGLSLTVSKQIGRDAAESLGFDPDSYDVDRTLHFLRAVADTWAANINAATLDQVNAALASDDEDDTPANVFDNARDQRAVAAAASLVTAYSGFATTEAGRQLGGGKAVKTWNTGPNPRSSHAAMNGETVGVDELFSNGLDWPGDGGDADEVAGCNCGVTISIP